MLWNVGTYDDMDLKVVVRPFEDKYLFKYGRVQKINFLQPIQEIQNDLSVKNKKRTSTTTSKQDKWLMPFLYSKYI